ncbi:MAG: glycosyltransferase family 2 protein [Candidatus Sungbacteria bacterium]|uniref:dolichyl-phosphate beta-glucosyltransferase n=1 Tax=Candidatus Sungiibacteriota bacterium TaxID=2750080 RepID=A0A932YWD0_9BACT|nr:glycosyltransferase family 2 protein [Candidatus Sungbacteria bacterium]
MHLSWVIPAYNEEKRIAKTLREVDEYLRSRLARKLFSSYEIIVANSASQDRTAAIVSDLTSQIQNLTLVNVENRGKGWAVKTGMLRARGDIRLFSDADNSTAPEYFDAMVPLFSQGYDIVISSRDLKDAPGASRDVKEPMLREILGNLGNVVIQIFGVWGIWDTQNGFKAFSAPAAQEIFSRSQVKGWAFDIEVLALARRLGYKIGIIPIRWRFDPDSKLTPGVYFEVLGDVFRIRWNLITGQYRLRS